VASAFCIKVAWLRGVGTRRPVDPQTATGLGPETIRLLDIGHSAGTYLTRELCYPLAPGRARGLRGLALALAFLAPLALVLGAPTSLWAALLALASAYCGMLVERWLFFAEATHVVSLFHGARSA
jgi:DMSO reductase anchor subunit